jgi:hypothetical protein
MSDANGKVPIPPEVLKGIEAVRVSGRTNMLDRNAAFWLDDKANRKTYAEGVFRGFREEKTVTP